MTAPFIKQFGFGAVAGDGYGLGYMTAPDNIPVTVTSYNSSKDTSSVKMADAIQKTLRSFDKLFK